MLTAPRIDGFVPLRHIVDELEQRPGGFPPALKRPVIHKPALPSYELEAGLSLEAA